MNTDLSLHVLSRLEELRPDFVRSIALPDILTFYSHIGRNRFLQCLARSFLDLDLAIETTRKAEDRIHIYDFFRDGGAVGTPSLQIHVFEAATKLPGVKVDPSEHTLAVILSQLRAVELNMSYGHPCFDAYALGGLLELDEWLETEGLLKPVALRIYLSHLSSQISKARSYTYRVLSDTELA